MKKIVILHAYSANNAGDGLLVDAAIELLEEASPGSEYTVLARHPDSFAPRDRTRFVSTRWTGPGSRQARKVLRSLDSFDLVVGVGGGYLRFGGVLETAKTAVAHLPQLIAAASTSTPTVYLPQSVGPEGPVVRALLRRLLSRITVVCLRDDRSVAELGLPNAVRRPDTALLDPAWAPRSAPLGDRDPVLSVRPVRRPGQERLTDLAHRLGRFDGWVQSRGAGNDDTQAVAAVRPRRELDRAEFTEGPRRVVVAVRLHAALMALRAGHWVVHLAYERKGFGAFADLGLESEVHPVCAFDPSAVAARVDELLWDEGARARYDDTVRGSLGSFARHRSALLQEIRALLVPDETVHAPVDGGERVTVP